MGRLAALATGAVVSLTVKDVVQVLLWPMELDTVTVMVCVPNPTIVPAAGIVLGGSGANRTLQITPAPEAFGNATITIRAVDPDGLFAQQMIGVTVNGVFVSFTSTVISAFGDSENAEPRTLRGFTFTQDADDDPTAFDQLLQ